ncbi:hypothetical protein V1514DRAFT_338698 [Lipomyces japonicus]|uniref:uncharacterized protein n=1 Tax=Lipomyces japonicus TaxID=56871 RepID=UPI0034CDBA63
MLKYSYGSSCSAELASDVQQKASQILDIRSASGNPIQEFGNDKVRDDIVSHLTSDPPKLPTYILYDAKGLQLFNAITKTHDYYLTRKETEILETSAIEIASSFPEDGILIELGCGSLYKTRLLLNALERLHKRTTYYALDLELSELQKAISKLDCDRLEYVTVIGLYGSYTDGRKWLSILRSNDSNSKVTLMWLGSSIGNFNRDEACQFISEFVEQSLTCNDLFLVGIDRRNDSRDVFKAYNDSDGLTKQFILNGLTHVNAQLGKHVFHLEDWDYQSVYHADKGYHEACYCAKRDVDLGTILDGFPVLAKGDTIKVEQSWKYSIAESNALFSRCLLTKLKTWTDSSNMYGLHLLSVPPFRFKYVMKSTCPSVSEWKELWKAWDTVAYDMMCNPMLHEKPIQVRNECIFYRGHIPTFLDIKLTGTLPLNPIQPVYFRNIFERGIDPDLDDVSKVHWHSHPPSCWPDAEDIKNYQDRVRERVCELYKQKRSPRKIWRALWLGFEHEAMHLETLMYMLVQSDRTSLPPVPLLDLTHEPLLPQKLKHTIVLELSDLELGFEDDLSLDDILEEFDAHEFTWDNERPVRRIHASGKLEVNKWLVSNRDYLKYLRASGNCSNIPPSWSGNLKFPMVKTVHGPISFDVNDHDGVAHWPVCVSYDELSRYADYCGNEWRLPTESELQSIYKFSILSKNNSLDVQKANVGFKHWHPCCMPDNATISGPGDMGVWEWTSTVLERHVGFEPERMYPDYTADFFDGKHNVVLGGSWATHPRIAGRKSFRNWYQRKYKYAFIGGRLVRNVK